MKKRLRVTALLLALLLALPGFALAEGGLLESPSLPDEPVVSCEHEFSHTFVEMTDRVEYTPEDADRHRLRALLRCVHPLRPDHRSEGRAL